MSKTSIFSISSLDKVVENEQGEQEPLYHIEIQDLARGFCGALFLAVPLHFTLEMWQRARVIPCWDIILIILFTYVANLGFNMFTGFKGPLERRSVFFDALTTMGIGALAAAITMLLVDQITSEMPLEVILKVIALEMIPTSFGASLAISQLGGGSDKKKDMLDRFSPDARKFVGATLGAIIFSFNIAATTEPSLIANSIQEWQLIGLIVFSLLISFLMVFTADFVQRDKQETGIMQNKYFETTITYAISLLVSAVLLWVFGYITPATPLSVSLPWIVVLGYPTTLGGSAGRLII